MSFPAKHQELQQRLDATLTALAGKLLPKQASYLAARGRYWQGLRNPALVPGDGAERDVDVALRPAHQTESWGALNLGADLPAKLPFSVQVDVCDGPDGKGYLVSALVRVEGQLWRRSLGIGSAAGFARTWRPVRELPSSPRAGGK